MFRKKRTDAPQPTARQLAAARKAVARHMPGVGPGTAEDRVRIAALAIAAGHKVNK